MKSHGAVEPRRAAPRGRRGRGRRAPGRAGPEARPADRAALHRRGARRHVTTFCRDVVEMSAECCSFSAASAPMFASQYAFFSIFLNLQDYQAEFFQNLQNFATFATFANFC